MKIRSFGNSKPKNAADKIPAEVIAGSWRAKTSNSSLAPVEVPVVVASPVVLSAEPIEAQTSTKTQPSNATIQAPAPTNPGVFVPAKRSNESRQKIGHVAEKWVLENKPIRCYRASRRSGPVSSLHDTRELPPVIIPVASQAKSQASTEEHRENTTDWSAWWSSNASRHSGPSSNVANDQPQPAESNVESSQMPAFDYNTQQVYQPFDLGQQFAQMNLGVQQPVYAQQFYQPTPVQYPATQPMYYGQQPMHYGQFAPPAVDPSIVYYPVPPMNYDQSCYGRK